DYVTNHVGKVITRDDESYDEFAELAAGGTYEDRQGRIKAGSEFILSTVLGVISTGKGGDSGTVVGVNGNSTSGGAGTNSVSSRDEFTGPYNPNATRADLEATHGAENVTSTTNPNNPLQTVNSNPDKGIEVIHGADGGKAVRAQFDDPVTGEPKIANIPYNERGLPVFDDHAKYTTTIDHSVSYNTQMKRATEDLRNAINDGRVDANQFTKKQLQDIQDGKRKIENYTWHHNGDTGNMQLIPSVVHNAVKHTGQNALS